DREADAELQPGSPLEGGELPALVVEFDLGEDQVRGDRDVAGDVELEDGLDHDLAQGIQHQAFGGRPVQVDADVQGAFQAQPAADLDPGPRVDDGDADAEAAADEEPQACLRRDVELGAAGDVRLLLVRGVVGDSETQLSQLCGTEAGAHVQAAADGGKDPDVVSRHRDPDDRDVDVDLEDVL